MYAVQQNREKKTACIATLHLSNCNNLFCHCYPLYLSAILCRNDVMWKVCYTRFVQDMHECCIYMLYITHWMPATNIQSHYSIQNFRNQRIWDTSGHMFASGRSLKHETHEYHIQAVMTAGVPREDKRRTGKQNKNHKTKQTNKIIGCSYRDQKKCSMDLAQPLATFFSAKSILL